MMASPSHADILHLVERAADRRRRTVLFELRRSVNGLATIIVIAPWLGLLATVFCIITSFVGCGGDAWTCLAAVVERLAHAEAPTALGLLIAVPAYWLHRHLGGQLELLDHDMQLGIGELMRQLRTLQRS